MTTMAALVSTTTPLGFRPVFRPLTRLFVTRTRPQMMSSDERNSTNATAGGELENNKKDEEEFKFSEEPSLETIRKMQAKFVDERDWDQYHEPRNLLLALVGEVGELTEIFQWKGEVKTGLPDWSAVDRDRVAQEMSDIVCYLVRLADKCRVDLPLAIVDKVRQNAVKYPVDRVKGDSRKYNEYD